MSGASVEDDPQFQLVGLEPGREIARVLFPRTCLNKGRYAYNGVSEVGTRAAAIHVMVVEEIDPPAAGVAYELDAALRLVSVTPSDSFRTRDRGR